MDLSLMIAAVISTLSSGSVASWDAVKWPLCWEWRRNVDVPNDDPSPMELPGRKASLRIRPEEALSRRKQTDRQPRISDARLLPYKQTPGGWNGLMQQCQHAIQRLKPAFPSMGKKNIQKPERVRCKTNHFSYKPFFSIVFVKFGVFGTFWSYLKFFTTHSLRPWNQNNGISAFN